MIKILDKEVKLNQIVAIGYLNSRRNYEIVSGRLYNYDDNYIYLDISPDFVSLDEVIRAKIENIKYCQVTIDNMWR